MAWTYFFIIIALAISPIVKADDIDSYATYGEPNGKYWNMLEEGEKSSFIIGIIEGLGMISDRALNEIKAGIDSKVSRDALMTHRNTIKFISENSPEGLILKETVADIDKFYSYKSNLTIPISTVYLQAVSKYSAAKKEPLTPKK